MQERLILGMKARMCGVEEGKKKENNKKMKYMIVEIQQGSNTAQHNRSHLQP